MDKIKNQSNSLRQTGMTCKGSDQALLASRLGRHCTHTVQSDTLQLRDDLFWIPGEACVRP